MEEEVKGDEGRWKDVGEEMGGEDWSMEEEEVKGDERGKIGTWRKRR